MSIIIKAALFALAVSTTNAVAPAQDAVTMSSTVGAGDADMPLGAMPRVAVPAVDSLLDQGELLTGEDPATLDPVTTIAEEIEEEIAAAETEEALGGLSLAALVDRFKGSEPRNAQMDCLARAIYFETRGEPLRGQLAVGEVIANRAASRKFPDSYCGVVKQHRQFSFVRSGRIPEPRRASKAWRTAVAIARIVDADHHETDLEGALFFHAKHVNPRWRLKRMGAIGNHIFYQ
ncbi:cell wall hydrolase [Sphingomicrobium sp. XHP0235]|uniref:cell wall hydrolase n=1 Tax=Sphingomicrobium aquimarinum TaxID=3133971 RepID=UPI0031FE5EBA